MKAVSFPLKALYKSIVTRFNSLATLAVAGITTVAQVCYGIARATKTYELLRNLMRVITSKLVRDLTEVKR